VSRRKFPVDLADPIFEYRGRYFQPQWPANWSRGAEKIWVRQHL